VYLPVAGRHAHARVQPGFKDIDLSVIVDFFNYFHRPTGVDARYCERQHYWEVGMRGYRVRDVKARLESAFTVVDVYRNRDWTPSMNFLLESKRGVRP
jgi:hypothetical protein